MKKIFCKVFLVLFLILCAAFVLYQFFGWYLSTMRYQAHIKNELGSINEEIFQPGEKIAYTLRYMGLPAGKAITTVEEIKKYDRKQVYSLTGKVRTSDFLSLFFEAEGYIKSYMDKERWHSLYFEEQSQASGHRKNEKKVIYNQEDLFLEVEGEKVKILPDTQDPLSAFYLLRLLDEEQLKEGYEINIKTRKRDRTFFAKFENREVLNTPFGKIPAIKVYIHLEPVKATSRHEVSGFMWFTDNKKRIPVLVKLKTKAGPATLLLYDLKI